METIYMSVTLSVGDFLSSLIQGCPRSQGSLELKETQGILNLRRISGNF